MSKLVKKGKKNEEHFHNEWALAVNINEVDARIPFEGITSPEYKAAIKSLGKIKNKEVLNIGCGLGEEAVYLALLGAKVTAIDLSKEMINLTKKLAAKYKIKNISYKVMDGEKMIFKDNSFDAVLGCAVLHHAQIDKMVKQSSRVLKKEGVAVFLEPLKYNPVINIYRRMANKVRTSNEHPLGKEDFKIFPKYFDLVWHQEFQFLTLLIFVWFFLGEKLHPNHTRYWKKIVWEGNKYKSFFKFLSFLDNVVLRIPFIRRYCWVTVIKCIK